MLKWTVMNKRVASEDATVQTTIQRHSATGSCNSSDHRNPQRSKPKRRRSTSSRRSTGARRSSLHSNRRSLNANCNKENQNQFTSTPIKTADEHFQPEALRDVSNITPKETFGRRIMPEKDENYQWMRNIKKKKMCLNPTHNLNLGGRYFESNVYASTLPNFQYSPRSSCLSHNFLNINHTSPSNVPPIFSHINLDENCPPSKKAKIDHVNDFLHQISCLASPEDKRAGVAGLPMKSELNEQIKVSPLVKKLVDLRFSKAGCEEEKLADFNNSSFINDLSLEKLVDAILDSPSQNNNSPPPDDLSVAVNLVAETRENTLNEDNLINTEQQRQTFLVTSSSTDSGFRSTSTEHSHRIDSNFICKCNNNNNNSSDVKRFLANSFCSDINCDKTIINLDETFNERCVDVEPQSRKRSSSSPEDPSSVKRFLIETSDFTLKRQKCIRRRKLADVEFTSSKQRKTTEDQQVLSVGVNSYFSETDLNDNSFDSSIFDKMGQSEVKMDGNCSGDLAVEKRDASAFSAETPTQNLLSVRRTRRCLSFDSPQSENSFIRGPVSGCMELDLQYASEELILTVKSCRDLYRSNGKTINAYVKVSLSERVGDGRRKQQGTLQRTAVQADSSKPTFNHTFRLSLQKADLNKRLYIEVWHRDRICRRSEFLGCMSFSVKNAIKKNISGTFHLLPQSTGRYQNVPITTASSDSTFSSDCQPFRETENLGTMCESQSSVEEIITVDDIDSDLRKNMNKAVLSQQQKDADENLFLRYLELDPTEGPEAIPAAMQRKATGNKYGKTPFTTTKKLTRAPKSGFGFSVVWTHPPRIERVEKGLPADRAGILPGDYIIFVDKHNVVMMPEIDILNLIRSYGNQLTLEIFRRNSSRNGSVPSVRRLTSAESASGLPPPSLSTQRRPSTICSTTNTTSVEYNRRRLHLPQVTFSAEVGNGVLV